MAQLPLSTIREIFKVVNTITRKQSPILRLFMAGMVILILGLAFYTLPSESSEIQPQPTPTPMLTPDGNFAVERIVDGDTLVVLANGQSHTVRLIGIDTPEVVDPRRPVQCFGEEASSRLKSMLSNRTVSLESDPTQENVDQYGRWLRYVYLPDGTNVNLVMVEQGFAHEYTYRIPYVQQQQFKQAQQRAREQEVGLWSPTTCNGGK